MGGKAIARSFDITDEASDKELVDVTVKEFGRLDGLFNVAAGLSPATLAQDGDVLSVSVEVWRHTIDVTLSGYMSASATRCPSWSTRAAAPSSTRCQPRVVDG